MTLTGENAFGLQAKLRQLVDAFVAEQGDMALERLDGEEASIERLQEALTSLPFLASKKLVVLRTASANKQFVERAEQLLSGVPETTDVILVEPKLDKRSSYYKFLKKATDFQEFNPLDVNGLVRWLTDEAKPRGGRLSAGDARYLVERVGLNQQLVSNELDKLLLYEPHISRQTIDLLTEPAPQSTVFELLDAALAGNRQIVLALYAEQRAQKVEPQQIIAMLAWQLHVLALIKTAGSRSADEIAKQAKISPYVVRKSLTTAKNMPLAALKERLNDLVQIDTASKTTALDLDEALQHYLLSWAV